ncbi:hypothetical protein [Planktothrix paucivesiculata]|uniref:Uncharacterized protein n=1 Tax=Planktothrix paucivesiculata PCC 9631 TaxID=671071 RepID=A0A7Z9BLJ9_9CYAN|nr:hypothetical protein [Planktothrix paucivesiculata]VXD15297.1 hypothetical protein PL9631_120029 [Planktothrix paucivesiculata PCC 9631]
MLNCNKYGHRSFFHDSAARDDQLQTGLFSRIYAHFVEQLKTNDRAYRAFELEYLPTINASLTEIGVKQ